MATEGPERVKSVSRVFDLLELIADAGGDATISQLATAAELPLPTIHRLLRTLVSEGYARQLANRRYALGPKLVRLGEVANRQFGQLAMPQLKSLVARLGETANLATIDGDSVVYVSQAPSPHAMRMFTEVGGRAPLHSTSVGKAILAQLDDDQVREIIGRAGMPHSTERSLDTIDALLADLALSRERGYAVDDGEHEIGVRCFAMAVPSMPVLTAVSISGPVSRVGEDFADQAIPVLREVVADISSATNAH
ncbi:MULTISPECIES: IclR family transcriptional regulator [unclassified Microbacterium]|uniref:IclR family transcriptional regulator n=1 Tax=unclassified Microbacterium TaxID=2609290 RepID=UPI001AC3A323|nr:MULTISPECIES: IclR family transcriptional regulator [unclassified Microbacterium]MBN9158913.1 IclR family transcriptional regulator [Microbacterium sp.]MBS1896871.1 IclR family transcriptional regulator [Actinomycetota bacterium]